MESLTLERIAERTQAARSFLSGRSGLALTELDPEVLPRMKQFLDLLLDWGQRMDLVAPASAEEQYRRHFLDSLAGEHLLELVCPQATSENWGIADVGSGAGFPGLVLAILRPDSEVELIESREKRCRFLNEVCSVLKLKNARVLRGRFEEIYPQCRSSIKIVISRALGNYPQFINISKELLSRNGSGLISSLVGPSFVNPYVMKDLEFSSHPYQTEQGAPLLSLACWKFANS